LEVLAVLAFPPPLFIFLIPPPQPPPESGHAARASNVNARPANTQKHPKAYRMVSPPISGLRSVIPSAVASTPLACELQA
jgi:hypothetical protein